MPEPLIAHIIGTTALIGAAVLVIASVVMVQQVNYIQAVNLMLSEAAESCARELVELVSLHTLGGGEYTYMELTLPVSLGGQPYNISLENAGENVIAVKAQLQLFKQVKVVVTPNFGQAPVYAVEGTVKFGDLTLTSNLLLPPPVGWRAALVAVKTGDAIIVGFTNQPPATAAPPSQARFKFTDWTKTIKGLAGSRLELTFSVLNVGGSAGLATIKVYDDLGRLVNQTTRNAVSGEVAWGTLTVRINEVPGTYYWKLVCEGWHISGSSVHDEVVITVIAAQPRITIERYDSSISGPPGGSVKLNLTLVNVGDYSGTAQVSVDGKQITSLGLGPGEEQALAINVMLPEVLGTYAWIIAVRTLETGYTDQQLVYLTVRSQGTPYINWLNETVEGLVKWQAKLTVKVVNPTSSGVAVNLSLNGTSKGSLVIPADKEAWINFTEPLPSQRGIYIWNITLHSNTGAKLDSKLTKLYVKDLLDPIRTALVFETFNSLPSGWTFKGRDWTIVSNALQGHDKGQGGFCSEGKNPRCAIAGYWNTSVRLDQVGSLSVLSRLYLGQDDKGSFRGFALIDSTRSKLYMVAAYVLSSDSIQLVLERLEGSWTRLDTSSAAGFKEGNWYTLILNVYLRESSLVFDYQLWNASTLLRGKTTSLTTFFQPSYFGLLVIEKKCQFDDFVIARSNAGQVTVRGLPAGWRVELLNANNQVVQSATSRGEGDIRLWIPDTPIISNAKVRFRDPKGNLILERTFSVVVGGDLFILSTGKD
ncbi:MAG: hypothetical protein N3E41_05735 [Thermofilaceae archaeon]|nr:hypothetical protein [Thermofilaceae archaeon]